MTDSSRRTAAAPTAPRAAVRHGRLRPASALRTALSALAGVLVVALVSGASVAAIAAYRLAAEVDAVDIGGETPTVGEWEGGFNVLIVGIDNAEGQADAEERDSTLNDVNMLVHVAEDQQSAVAVSIPRDLMVDIPTCQQEDGSTSDAVEFVQINSAYGRGGLPCVVDTVEQLTGLEIPYAGTISFDGVARMSSAVGGVEVCIDAPISDPYTGLNLSTAGTHTVEGYEALAFLRTRYGVGDGGDLSRISNQQTYLSSLVRKVQSDGVLTDLGALYGLARVTTESMELSTSLAPLDTMVAMARVLADMPTENIVFVQYPGETVLDGDLAGRVVPLEDAADALLERIRNDERFLPDEPEQGTVADPNAPNPAPSATAAPAPSEPAAAPSATPSSSATAEPEPPVLENVPGQTAADRRCSAAND
ncbi:LCP family protein [Microcella alkalica]|uniref:LCP family protein n=1 Tax=Microcella alkalica TaxID=355930 RepID=UPI00145D52F3|nr:LCP family protein [Microcella alkalica]